MDDSQSSIENQKKESQRASFFSIISNTLLALIKWSVGIVGNSYAMIADAIESTADIFSSVLVYFGNKYSYKPADKSHPYGHGRMEVVVTFAVVGFLIASSVIIAVQSVQNILEPHESPKSFTLYVLAAIIIWKEISYQWVVYKAKKLNSTSLLADAWHHRSDAITSIAAFIGISIAIYMGPGYESADDWAALFAACFLFYNSLKILKPALEEVLDKQTNTELEQKIREVSCQVPGVLCIDKCYTRKSGVFYFVDIHVVVEADMSVAKGHAIGHQVKETLKHHFTQIADVLTHVEPSNEIK